MACPSHASETNDTLKGMVVEQTVFVLPVPEDMVASPPPPPHRTGMTGATGEVGVSFCAPGIIIQS